MYVQMFIVRVSQWGVAIKVARLGEEPDEIFLSLNEGLAGTTFGHLSLLNFSLLGLLGKSSVVSPQHQASDHGERDVNDL